MLVSDTYGPLTAQLRYADATGHDPETLLPRLVAAHGFDDADDIAAVLHHRIQNATARPAGAGRHIGPRARLIAGLIPEATGPMPDDVRHALDQRKQLIEERVQELAETALREKPSWIRQLGMPPADPYGRRKWMHAIRAVAAYRDRYQITTDRTFGAESKCAIQRAHETRVRAQIQGVQQAHGPRQRPPSRSFSPILPPSR